MDITINPKLEKRKSEDGLERQSLDKHIENLKKIKSIKIPGTTKLMPLFDYSDSHVRLWIANRIRELKNNFEPKSFLRSIAEKIECYGKDGMDIRDEEELTILNGKIIAMAPDLKDLPEFDWDDPEQKKWAEGQIEKWEKKHPKRTQEEVDEKIDDILESEKEHRKKTTY